METVRRRSARLRGEASGLALGEAKRVVHAMIFVGLLLVLRITWELDEMVLVLRNGGSETVELVCVGRTHGGGKLFLHARFLPWPLGDLLGRDRFRARLAPGERAAFLVGGLVDSTWEGVLVRDAAGRVALERRRWITTFRSFPGLGQPERGALVLGDPGDLPEAPSELARVFPR